MKEIFTLLFLLLIYISCKPLTKDSKKKQNLSSYVKIEQAAGEKIDVYNEVNGDLVFTIEEGEIFLKENISENKEWSKIYLDNKSGYILNSKISYKISDSSKNINEKVFIAYNKMGTPLCKRLPKYKKCEEILKNINYLEKVYFLNPRQINNGSGTWLKVESDGLVGFINRNNLIPESIFQPEQVENFKKKFKKICSTKVSYLSKNTNICYSTKIFQNGDAGEEWKERVYFMIDDDSIEFRYGRKYIETFGLIFKVEQIEQNKFRMFYLDSFDFIENSILVEVNFQKKAIYAPMPETMMTGTYKQELKEILEFKNGLEGFR